MASSRGCGFIVLALTVADQGALVQGHRGIKTVTAENRDAAAWRARDHGPTRRVAVVAMRVAAVEIDVAVDDAEVEVAVVLTGVGHANQGVVVGTGGGAGDGAGQAGGVAIAVGADPDRGRCGRGRARQCGQYRQNGKCARHQPTCMRCHAV